MVNLLKDCLSFSTLGLSTVPLPRISVNTFLSSIKSPRLDNKFVIFPFSSTIASRKTSVEIKRSFFFCADLSARLKIFIKLLETEISPEGDFKLGKLLISSFSFSLISETLNPAFSKIALVPPSTLSSIASST